MEPINRLEEHNLRLIANKFYNGLATQPFDKRSARGIKAAICYEFKTVFSSIDMEFAMVLLLGKSNADPIFFSPLCFSVFENESALGSPCHAHIVTIISFPCSQLSS